MTEPAPGRPESRPVPGKRTPERRHPLHLAVALGVSAGVYAGSLALVSALQAEQEASLAADRAPALDALAALRAANDRLAAEVDRATQAYRVAGDGYQRVAGDLGRYDAGLGRLASSVAAVAGAAVDLPANAPLPAVGSVRPVTAPTVHATTGASGKP